MSEAAAPRGPLATPLFRALWIATIVSNIGTWMNDVGSSWLMTSLSPSPLWVAMVQAATTLPMFVFALPAGALADVIDRRKLLIASQMLILAGAASLAAITWSGLITPPLLLALTAVMGLGAALGAPAFQAIVPELVGKPSLADAIALNSLGVNIARAMGPALGGVIVALSGPAAVYALNAVSILAVLGVLFAWRRQALVSTLPAEHFFGALRAGYRYARHAPALQLVLVRSVAFFLFSSALWALLPLVGRQMLGLDAAGYGVLLGSMGAGAVAGAVALARVRKHVSANRLSVIASLLFAVATLSLGRAGNAWVAGGIMVVAGVSWITMLSGLNVAAQMAVPAWIKARALAVYLLVFQGAMTAGSILWGIFASRTDIPTTLTTAAVALGVATLAAFRFRLPAANAVDLTPSGHWAEPVVTGEHPADRGPVMILIEYRVDPARTVEFVRELHGFKPVRQRDGALRWNVFEDAETPGLIIESFVVASWLEHLRQHERVTHEDRLAQESLRRFHTGDRPPVVRHLIAPNL
ncbi:MFS transporter [Brevundimonas sp. Root1423]|uniref:MFS transporter n=1 Tax=Brevundimonas sp. Root1423 TaxID=1736462 RepID=UPI0006FFA584|nr:MFS transporter [Brevundimonas sp. Root1423]KQY89795.1 MFS transporter [Brevundimonas sp. Root1423]